MAGNLFENFISIRPDWEVYTLFNSNEITKTRYVDIASNYTLLRIDKGDEIKEELTIDKFVEYLKLNDLKLKDLDAIIFCDYNKGYLNQGFIEEVSSYGRTQGFITFIDTKKILGAWSQGIGYVKINEKEFRDQLKNSVDISNSCENLIVTLGGMGSYWWNEQLLVKSNPTSVIDLSGAGDTYFAAMISHLLDNGKYSLLEAMNYANSAAGVSVSKRGVVKVTTDEVNNAISKNLFEPKFQKYERSNFK
jgi:bifunctional ADP-heptose synthase (sugar kinase/adenylyltransferase)